jgi:hypothetical protein
MILTITPNTLPVAAGPRYYSAPNVSVLRNKEIKIPVVIIVLMQLVLTACASRPCCSDYIEVNPIKYVNQEEAVNSRFGWLDAEVNEAIAYRVRVGNKQYRELLDRVGEAEIIEKLALFAEDEVIKEGYCPSGETKTKIKGIYGPHTGEHVPLIVECVD